MCNKQTTKSVELQGNGNAVANVKNAEIKPEFLELQEFVIGWFGSTKTAAKKLQNLYFQFINVQLEADGCVLQSFLDELYFIQSMIEILRPLLSKKNLAKLHDLFESFFNVEFFQRIWESHHITHITSPP